MRLNPGDIRAGMPVYGIDGRLVGRVDRVCKGPRAEAAPFALKPEVEVEAVTINWGDTAESHREFCVPASAICILFPGQNITLEYTQEVCAQVFLDETSAPGNEADPVRRGQEGVELVH